uniref:Uncharacterized protein n=1 Tax=Glycine max TaxID=3847 RepID=C6T768_SOYBN|nr:unknown [Glycine max]
MASATTLFTPNPMFSTEHHSLSPSPTIPKSFTGLCKPFHSRVPTSIPSFHCRRPKFFVRATVIKWRCPKQTIPPDDTGFQKKLLYLESIGIDSFSLIENHPTVITTSLADIKSTVEYITSLDFTAIEFRRMVGMCPDILTTQVSDLIPVFTFLHREVHVPGSHIKRVINRRPRLLVCSVSKRLRPTLYFLQSIGIEEVTSTLTCYHVVLKKSSCPGLITLRISGFLAVMQLQCSEDFLSCFVIVLKITWSLNTVTLWWRWGEIRRS